MEKFVALTPVRFVGSSSGDEKSHNNSNVESAPPTANFSITGAPEGEKKPSITPAITSMASKMGG